MPYVVIDHILYEQSRKENTYYRIYEEKPVRPGGVKAGREQGSYPRYKLLEQVSQNGSENPDKETEQQHKLPLRKVFLPPIYQAVDNRGSIVCCNNHLYLRIILTSPPVPIFIIDDAL